MSNHDPAEVLERIGARVRRSRAARGMTLREAAGRAGLSVRFWSELEAGRANIAVGRLAAVADALGTRLEALVADRGGPRRDAVALLGLRGAGKSTLGPRLAAALGLTFVELDDRIEEEAGLSLEEIFSLHGEPYYRRLARRCLERLLDAGRPVVLALPGGIVHDDEAFDVVRSRCTTAWLRARPEDHLDRVLRQGDRRPVRDRPDAMADLRGLLASREPLYARSDVTVDTSLGPPSATLRRLLADLEHEGWRPA